MASQPVHCAGGAGGPVKLCFVVDGGLLGPWSWIPFEHHSAVWLKFMTFSASDHGCYVCTNSGSTNGAAFVDVPKMKF
jgi:hypothetical protein